MNERAIAASDVRLRDLRGRLDARRPELERATLARIAAIADPGASLDPTYAAGLRSALSAGLEYGLAAVATPVRDPGPVPVELLAQARLAARNGVSLDAVLRRYSAGHSLLADGLLEEAAALGLGASQLQSTLRALALRYDRIVAAVSEEYEREAAADPRGAERRRYTLLRRLLAGEPLDSTPLCYPLGGHHIALVAAGEGGAAALAELGEGLDRRLLLAEPDPQVAWAWLGGRRPFEPDEIERIASHPWPRRSAVACGELGQGIGGWRLSHRQAAAALPVARRAGQSVVLYSEVALIAAVLQDDLLAASLRQAYLVPLAAERKAGETAKRTLRAYFEASRNITSAAALLGVSRRTVASRLASAEERLGSPLDAVAAELEIALRLDEVEGSSEHR